MRHLKPFAGSFALVGPLGVLALFAATTSLPVAHADTQPPAPSAAPALPPAQDVVNAVQAFYNKNTSFKSEFNQSFLVKAYSTTKHSHGKVVFVKPGKMDWTYDDPAGNRVVSDGTTVRIYDAANGQLFEQPVANSPYPSALSFLTGQGQLSASFDFELRAGEGPMGFPGGYVLIGTPKTPTPAYQKVLFYVDKASMQIRRVLILDGQSNQNRFDFVDPQVNLPVDPNQFVFVAPPNTTIVHP
jgi:outer membrane lipoprotein carrier protein